MFHNNNPYDFPYYYQNQFFYPPYQKPSLLQKMKYSMQQMNISSTIKTTQKTLYTINQIIPIIHQLKPVISNATTAFKVAKVVKSIDDLDEEIDNNL